MSLVDDFDAIKADLAKLEQAKAKQPMNVAVEEGSPTDWTDVNLYGYALMGGPRVDRRPEDDLTCFKAMVREEFEPLAKAIKAYEDSQRRYLSPFWLSVMAKR